jgi:prevent-host-death family protein
MEARRRLGELIEGVYYRGDEVIIERGGKPMAAVLPIGRLQSIEAARAELGDLLAEPRGDDLTEDEAMELALEAQRAVRRQKRREVAKRTA